LEDKLRELRLSLAAAEMQRSGLMKYELTETIWSEVMVEKVDFVYLWLGVRTHLSREANVQKANVMVEYSVEEAIELLTAKLDNAVYLLKQTELGLEYIREQVTTMEVK
jgi:hypothetical protein